MFQTKSIAGGKALAFLAAMALATAASAAPPAHAGKPGAHGGGPPGLTKHAHRYRHGRHRNHHEFRDDRALEAAVDVFFNAYRRNIIRDYYRLPHELTTRLGYDSSAYKLIRVGGDILRIAVGSGVVVDALHEAP